MSLSNPTLSNPKFGNHQIAGILAILLLVSGGVELTVYTLQLQHSSCPLLDWSDKSAPQCPPLVAEVPQPQPINDKTNESKNSNNSKESSHQIAEKPTQKSETKQPDIVKDPTPPIPRKPSTEPNKPSINIDGKEIAAIAVGSTAIAALALLEIPLVVAAGAGTAIWFIARTLIDLNH